MNTLDQVELVMEEVGPALPNVDTVARDGKETLWAVEFDDATVVNVEYDQASETLILTADVPAGPEENRAKAYEAALVYNSLAKQTGVSFQLPDPEQPLLLVAEAPAADVTLADMETLLTNFSAKARLWRENFELGISAGGGSLSHEDTLSAGGALRV